MCYSFVQNVHLRIYLWFTSYQQGVLSKTLLFKTAVYSTCHFTSKKKKIRCLSTEMWFQNGNVRGRKLFVEIKNRYCLFRVFLSHIWKEFILYLNTVFSHLLVWILFQICATLIHHLSNEYIRDISRRNGNSEVKKLMFCSQVCLWSATSPSYCIPWWKKLCFRENALT